MVDSFPVHAPVHSAGWGRKAVAVLMLLGATSLFVVTVVWPIATPFVPMEFAPRTAEKSVVHTFDDSPVKRHRR